MVAVIGAGFLLFGRGGGTGSDKSVYPDGGEVPPRKVTGLEAAAKAADCELRSVKVASRDHVPGEVDYPSAPPAGGDHLAIPAEDGIYTEAPQKEALVHGLEHGRVIIWFKRRLRSDVRATLKALVDEDSYQTFLSPDPTSMPYEVAATAWNREPEPLGTGRLLGCATANDRTYDALAAFRDEHRGNGPEPIP